MADETIFSAPLFRDYILPFLLVFVILYGVLEKTKLFGDSKHQINALTSFVIALIFVGYVLPKQVVNNLVLYLAITLVIILIFLILYGFVGSGSEGFKPEKWMKIVFGILIGVSLIIAVLFATGSLGFLINLLFDQSWSRTLWVNVVFVVIMAAAIAVVLSGKRS